MITHLHVHDAYNSILDAIITPQELVNIALEQKAKAIGLTGHGSMASTIEFYTLCKEKNIKPIIGCEFYVTDDMTVKDKTSKYNHLILLAKDNVGYENLKILSSKGYLDGFYYKPRIDHKLLEKHSQGLVCLSACLAGELSEAILNNENTQAVCDYYKDLFGTDYYLEIQSHTDEQQILVNKEIIKLAKKNNIKIVTTTDAHFPRKEDFEAHRVFMNISSERETGFYEDCYLQDEKTVRKILLDSGIDEKDIDEAINSTNEIANKCNVEIELGVPYLPHIQLPNGYDSEYDYMVHLIKLGMKQRGITELPNKQEYIDRIKYELEVIKYKGFEGYFLNLDELIKLGKKENIPFGKCRGSAGGSLVCYCMGITNVDPIKYNLDFSRFLTKERTELPDVDTDVSTRHRGEFIDLITEVKGKDNVTQIGTFGTLATKAVINAVGKVMNINKDTITEFKKIIGENKTIKIKDTDFYKEHKEYCDMCIRLDGLPRSLGSHAGGVCVSGGNKPVVAYSPLRLNKDNKTTTQFEMHMVEKVGLVKYDMLGLSTLDILADTCKYIGSSYYDFVYDYDDQDVYEMLSSGDTMGVFQAETNFMTNVITKIKPHNIQELSDAIAIGRPDSIKYLEPYCKAKFEGIYPEQIHKDLDKILSRTYGCLIYQEQIMNITKVFAGFSDGQADNFRSIIAKKKMDRLPKALEDFEKGATERGYDKETIDKLIQLLKDNASYSFNMSHSVGYALIVFETAYHKYHNRIMFMCSVINNQRNEEDGSVDYEGVMKYVKWCKDNGINIILPNINKSDMLFVPEPETNSIYFGFALVKGVSSGTIKTMFEKRPFRSYKDCLVRFLIDIDKTSSIALCKCGAVDCFNLERKMLIKYLFSYRYEAEKEDKKPIKKLNKTHYQYLFENGIITESDKSDTDYCLKLFNKERKSSCWKEFEKKYLKGTELDWETETIGTFMSGNPFEGMDFPNWNDVQKNGSTYVAGTIVNVTKTKVKKGKSAGSSMAFINVDTTFGVLDCVVFSDKWLKLQDFCKQGTNVVLSGEKTGDLLMTVKNGMLLSDYKARISCKYS